MAHTSRTVPLRSYFSRLLCAAALLAVLSACAAPAPAPTPTLVPATPTPTPLPSPTLLPSATPQPTLTPEPHCTQTHGMVRALAIHSEAVQGTLHFNLYLPPCYDPGAAYPVLYLLHGQTYAQDQWVRLGAPDAADTLIAAGEAPPFLIVMPQEPDTLANPFDTGFEQALIDELIPWINANAAVCSARACQAIGGLSRGGSWAVWLGFSHWELFGAIGAHSLPPFYGTETRLNQWLQAIPAGELPLVWLDIGQSDPYLADATAFEKLLTRLDVPHEWHLTSGNHAEDYWSAHVEEYLRWYAQPWQAAINP